MQTFKLKNENRIGTSSNPTLVYDPQRYIFRILKSKFSAESNFKICKNFKELHLYTESHSLVVIVIYSWEDFLYSWEDIINLLRIYDRKPTMLFCTFGDELNEKVNNLEEIISIDISGHKQEITKKFEDVLKKLF